MLLKFCDWLVYGVLRLNPNSLIGKSINFFIYDSLKILFLLFLLIFVIGVIRTYLPQKKIKEWMSRRGGSGNVFAALFGAVTPFCSCSSIPIFIGFLEAGIPLGVTFSFLIASPLINEYLVVLMLAFFGWKITLFYVISGLMVGIISGIILGKMKLEKYLVKDFINEQNNNTGQVYLGFKSRLNFGWKESVSIVKKIWCWVLIGVGIGAVIHNYVPLLSVIVSCNKLGWLYS